MFVLCVTYSSYLKQKVWNRKIVMNRMSDGPCVLNPLNENSISHSVSHEKHDELYSASQVEDVHQLEHQQRDETRVLVRPLINVPLL